MTMTTTHSEKSTRKTDRHPEELPILPSGKTVVFPAIVFPLVTQESSIVRLIDEALAHDKVIGIFAQHPDSEAAPGNMCDVGTSATITKMLKMPDGSIRVFLQGQKRIRLVKLTQKEPFLKGT